MLNNWYIAANSSELKDKPLACKILNEPLVLFRNLEGIAVSLINRCPHRNIELSKGKVVNGNLRCAYHGWEFNDLGKCVFIPSLCDHENIPNSSHASVYPIIEQDSYIWIWIGNRKPESNELPFKIPTFNNKKWRYSKIQGIIKNSVDNVIENFIDCPHTGYIHGGLFRTPASHLAKTHISVVEDGVIIEIDEEKQSDSVLARFLIGKNNKQIHQDRFIMPSIIQVSYSFGESRKMVGYHICTPMDDMITKLYVHTTWHFGILNSIIYPFVPIFGKKILAQDIDILDNQGSVIKHQGENFVSSTADTANIWIKNFRQKAKKGEKYSLKEKDINFRL